MAVIKVSYHCGCGYKTENLLGAVLHCDQQGHSMEATGTITKDQKEKKGD